MQSDLFNSAESEQVTVIEPENDGNVLLANNFFDAIDADRYYKDLLENIAWEEREIVLFGKRHKQPRLVAWYGDPGITYRYSGDSLTALPWTETLLAIRDAAAAFSKSNFNSVLLNLYRNGDDAMGWHADNEPELGSEPVIASVSFGTTRRFDLKHRSTGEKRQVALEHGSVLLMAGKTQRHWVHQIARTKKVSTPRINLTFRQVTAA